MLWNASPNCRVDKTSQLDPILNQINVAGNNKSHLGLHVKCLILTKFGICRRILVEFPSTKFFVNLCSGRHAVTCGGKDGRTDSPIPFRPKRSHLLSSCKVPVLTKFIIYRQIFVKGPNMECHGNPSGVGRSSTCAQKDGRTAWRD